MITHYRPKHFKLHELVPPETIKLHGDRAWNFLNPLALWTLDELKKEYPGILTVNNYGFKGMFKYRGYRPRDCKVGAADSAHRHGNAFDCNFENYSADRVREDLFFHLEKNGRKKECFKYITEVETGDDMGWFHFAVTNHDISNGIFVFKR